MSVLNYSFYRPETHNLAEWDNIVGKLRFDALRIFTEMPAPYEQKRYALAILQDLRPAGRDGLMLVLDLGEAEHRTPRERLLYSDDPSYCAAGILLNTALRCPRLLEKNASEHESELDRQLRSCDFRQKLIHTLYGCLCTDFDSNTHGQRRQEEIIRLFALSGASQFMDEGMHLEPKFFQTYRNGLQRFADSPSVLEARLISFKRDGHRRLAL